MDHYEYLDKYFATFLKLLNLEYYVNFVSGIIACDGDKCYGYRYEWDAAGIPFSHGVAIYLLGKMEPYCHAVRDTANGWVAPDKWVIDNYKYFENVLIQSENIVNGVE